MKLNILLFLCLLGMKYHKLEYSIVTLGPIKPDKDNIVRTGLDVLLEDYPSYLKGKRIGLITNQTGISRNNQKNYQLFQSNPDIFLKTIFAPEHGFHGEASAGAKVIYDNHNISGPEIISLYGTTRRPTIEMLKEIDLIIYDIQDIGARFYTYISTLGMAMEAAGDFGIEFMVLDRPNPIGGEIFEGSILDTSFKSFVGYYPIPIRYGMTVGELTNMAINEKWLSSTPKEITIVKMDGWKRSMFFDDTGLPWVAPSPNIPDLETAIIYPGMCLIEGTNISEGRGTRKPFKQIGAPWITKILIERLQNLSLNGVKVDFTNFFPKSIPGKALNPKFENKICYGSSFEVTDKYKYRSLETGLYNLSMIKNLYENKFQFTPNIINKLYGNESLSNYLDNGTPSDEIEAGKYLFNFLAKERKDIEKFIKKSSKYFLYD